MPPTVCANVRRAVYGAAQNPQFPLPLSTPLQTYGYTTFFWLVYKTLCYLSHTFMAIRNSFVFFNVVKQLEP